MAQQYESLSIEDHIRTKDLWAGSVEPIETPMLIFTRPQPRALAATIETIKLSPALFKCIDEPIVNALDQAQRSPLTTVINIAFDAQTGQIIVANNGEGIPIAKQPGTDMPIPQFIFGVVFTGSNMRKDTSTSTLGGTNGIGIKITNIHSREFQVQTVDATTRQIYKQRWTNGMRECEPPIIVPLARNATEPSGTTLTFSLNYEHFKTNAVDFERVVFTRVIWAALYAKYFLPNVAIHWCGKRIAYEPQQYIAAILGSRQRKAATAQTPLFELTETKNAIVIIAPNTKRFCMSVINGIMVPDGNHIEFVISQIKESAKDVLAKKLNTSRAGISDIAGARNIATNMLTLIIWRATGVHWTSQSKDRAQFLAKDLRRALELPDKFIEKLSSNLANAIIEKLNTSSKTHTRSQDASGPRIQVDKYSPAHYAGTKRSAECRLFLAEGDSAKSQVCRGIAHVLDFNFYGVLSLRGVIINVRKETTDITDERGKQYKQRSKKMIDNKFITTLVQVLGLDFANSYETEKQRATLRYGGVIGCVDQDLDGVGNIFSLLLNLFHLYWPHLLTVGYVQRLATPIIRVYPRATSTSRGQIHVLEFYSDEEYRKWEDDMEAVAPGSVSTKYRAKYYKGLGKHSAEEMSQIMRNMQTQIITYQMDDDAGETFEIYLGRDPALRRGQLSKPPPEKDDDIETQLTIAHAMPASYHLMREAHLYQLDNLQRKLNCVVDGANQVSRKILNGCRKIFAHSHEDKKVAEIAGKISSEENYHHGEESLQNAIKRRAFIAPGGNQLPMLLPFGNFGTRLEGGQDASPARYITTSYNTHLNSIIYNDDDYPLLQFRYDEGKRGEPQFFMPIVPMCILEPVDVPSHGWNICVHAREVVDVIAALRALIKSDGRVSVPPLRPCCYPLGEEKPFSTLPRWDENYERIVYDCATNPGAYMWHGYIIQCIARKSDTLFDTWSIGTYEWVSDDEIKITELPLGIWSEPYVMTDLEKIANMEGSFVKKYKYIQNPDVIDITITFDLESPAFQALNIEPQPSGTKSPPSITDPLIRALHLRDHMCDKLNFIMPDDSVHTFANYEDVLRYWFPLRKEFYAKRIERQLEFFEVWIAYYDNVIRYIDMESQTAKKRIATMTIEEAETYLAKSGFTKLNMSALQSPEIKYEPSIRAVVERDASYAYILNLRERDITIDGRTKYESEREQMREKHTQLTWDIQISLYEPFIGAKIWLRELEELEKVVVFGRKTNWQYENYGRFVFESATAQAKAPPQAKARKPRAKGKAPKHDD